MKNKKINQKSEIPKLYENIKIKERSSNFIYLDIKKNFSIIILNNLLWTNSLNTKHLQLFRMSSMGRCKPDAKIANLKRRKYFLDKTDSFHFLNKHNL